MSKVKVEVVDASDFPIPEATVQLNQNKPLSVSGDGKCDFVITEQGQANVITVQAPSYVKETIHFQGTIAQSKWDNALLWRTLNGDQVELTVHLGRLETAPIVEPTVDVWAVASKAYTDLLGVRVTNVAGTTQKIYKQLGLQAKAAEFIGTRLLPEPGPTAGAIGWDCFNTSIANPPVDPKLEGRFYYLVHRGAPSGLRANQKRFGVAIWSPNIDQATSVSALDMIVFFSPSTFEKSYHNVPYPFGVKPDTNPDIAYQSYMWLWISYLLDQMGFVYQLMAQRQNGQSRKAVMIMPISPHGDWGPYSCGEGMFRLCREVALFLHRECRTSNIGLKGQVLDPSSRRVPDDLWYAGGSLRDQPIGIYSSTLGMPPKPGRIVISGFSGGLKEVEKVMQSWGLPTVKVEDKRVPQFQQRYWGCLPGPNHEDPVAAWHKAWQEIWDLDGDHDSWSGYMALLNRWAFPSSGETTRMIRLIHRILSTENQGIIPPHVLTSELPIWKKLRAEGTPHSHSKLREVQGTRWTAIALKPSYFKFTKPPQPPSGSIPFGTTWRDAHHAVPQIGFSHFLALSPIGLPP